jgi:hypothetical protein
VGVTPPSAWPWLDHSVSGLPRLTKRPFQTRFRCAYTSRLKLASHGNSLTHYTKGTPSPRPGSHQVRLRLLVGIRFQVSFTPLVGVLFTFPSRYSFAIGHQGVFRLGGWSPHLRTGFHVSRPTQGSRQELRVRDCHPLRPAFPDRSASLAATTGLIRFRSPLLAESRLMSVPPGTEMFQFPGFASFHYEFMKRYPKGVGCPIRTSTDQRLLAAPHGFSQRATSFIASWCQGIHRMPFITRDPRGRSNPLTRNQLVGNQTSGNQTSRAPCAGTIPGHTTTATATAAPPRPRPRALSLSTLSPLNTARAAAGQDPAGQTSQRGAPRDAPEPDSP